MPSTTVIISIGILIVSFLVGLLFFYVTSPHAKKTKKQLLDETTSLLFNFVIYIWIGKVIVNFPKFIKDPLAVLAYPSNSAAFYIATLFIVVNILYVTIRKKKKMYSLLQSFIPIFLAASFMYEFLQIVVEGSRSGTIYLALLMVLLILFLVLQGKVSIEINAIIILMIWIVGQLVLSFTYGYTTIFGYMIVPIYFISLFIIVLLFVIVRKKGQV